jgi:hypothetical protein
MLLWFTDVVCIRGVGEFVAHLLHCKIDSALLSAIFNCVGLAWVILNRVVACWRGLGGSLQNAAMWMMLPSYFLWCVRRERNDRSFEDGALALNLRSPQRIGSSGKGIDLCGSPMRSKVQIPLNANNSLGPARKRNRSIT